MLDNNAVCHRGCLNQACESLPSPFQALIPKTTVTVRWCAPFLLIFSPPQYVLVQASVYSISLFAAFHYYPSGRYIPKHRVSVKQSPHSNFILITNHTHAALYLKRTGGVKTQCFIKTIVMAFGQRWPQPSQPFGLMRCSLSHFEASPWRSRSFPWPPASAIEVVRL